jgi:serine/threonine-protein kinase
MEGQRIGTPLYMAPELLLDTAKANPQSEVYSLGALLYQCLTGKVPFEASGLLQLVDLIEEGKLVPLQSLCPEAPAALGDLCLRSLHKDPAARPQSVSELAGALAACA